jgi:16S rRNA (adenine1518-N6/adenine1519-N6)-dimethyltransferase
MELFAQQGFRPRGDYGQNFLIDINLVEYIVAQGELTPQDIVLEVGSGTGGLTAFLAQQAGHVVSIELDRNVFPLAQHSVREFDNVTLINTDALKNKNNFSPHVLNALETQLAEIPGSRIKLVANLPYSIATPVISNLVASDLPWERIVATIQWELALKMATQPGGGTNYGALSVWLQSQCDVEILKKLGPTVFWPRPKVDSAIIKLVPNSEKRERIHDRTFFHDFSRRLFHHRRKQMRGVLAGMYRKELGKQDVDRILQELGYDENARAEEKSVDQIIALSNRLREELGRHAANES